MSKVITNHVFGRVALHTEPLPPSVTMIALGEKQIAVLYADGRVECHARSAVPEALTPYVAEALRAEQEARRDAARDPRFCSYCGYPVNSGACQRSHP